MKNRPLRCFRPVLAIGADVLRMKVIIRIEKLDVGSLHMAQARIPSWGHASIGPVDILDPLSITASHGFGVVIGSVIYHDDLDVRISLGQTAVDRSRQKVSLSKTWYHHRHQRRRLEFMRDNSFANLTGSFRLLIWC